MNKTSLLFVVLLLIIAPTQSTYAADMYTIVNKAQVHPGEYFTGLVYISTGGLSINNAEATVHFPNDLVSVEGVSTAGSIFNIWVEQPSFSNVAGTVSFNGGIPTPGYTGQAGQAVIITFKAKSVGTGTISLGAPAIRANDGSGTNVLSQARNASITIVENTPPPPTTQPSEPPPKVTEPAQIPGAPRAPVITSTDMPDQNAWYNLSKAMFSWGVPADVSTVQLILSSFPNSLPTISYQPPIKNKTLENLEEGVLYLNARFENSIGWSKTTSRKIQIDLSEPTHITIKPTITDDDLLSLRVSAKDTLSGVHSFIAEMDGIKIAEVNAKENTGVLVLPALTEGKNIITIKAVDNAGNTSQLEATIEAPGQKPPKITHYPELIKVGSKIEIRGKAIYPDSPVLVWVVDGNGEKKSYKATPDEDRIFAATTDIIKTDGETQVWAVTERAPNVFSAPSEKVYISVKETEAMWIGLRAAELAALAVITLRLFFLFFILLLLGTRKVRRLKYIMRKELLHTEQDIHKVFATLRYDTKRRKHLLEDASTKRKLTKEEDALLSELMIDLSEAEKFLTDEIHDIERHDLS